MSTSKTKKIESAGESKTDQDEETEKEPDILEDVDNIALFCTLENQLERFVRCIEDENDPQHERLSGKIDTVNAEGKTALHMASILGRMDMLTALINHGSDVNFSSGTKGYTALHLSSAWGKIESLKALVENGSELQQKTGNGERAREVAARYSHAECVDFLDWAEAKQTLQKTLVTLHETITDPEKIQGKLSRDDKNIMNNLIKGKSEWIETMKEATTQDFMEQKEEVDQTAAPILEKLLQT